MYSMPDPNNRAECARFRILRKEKRKQKSLSPIKQELRDDIRDMRTQLAELRSQYSVVTDMLNYLQYQQHVMLDAMGHQQEQNRVLFESCFSMMHSLNNTMNRQIADHFSRKDLEIAGPIHGQFSGASTPSTDIIMDPIQQAAVPHDTNSFPSAQISAPVPPPIPVPPLAVPQHAAPSTPHPATSTLTTPVDGIKTLPVPTPPLRNRDAEALPKLRGMFNTKPKPSRKPS